MPHLLDIQRNSYKWFLDEGLQEIFNDISPIKDFSENLVLSFESFSLGEPKYGLDECKERDVTYAAPIRVNVRLINRETGMPVYIAEYPLDCVAEGTGKILENINDYQDALTENVKYY